MNLTRNCDLQPGVSELCHPSQCTKSHWLIIEVKVSVLSHDFFRTHSKVSVLAMSFAGPNGTNFLLGPVAAAVQLGSIEENTSWFWTGTLDWLEPSSHLIAVDSAGNLLGTRNALTQRTKAWKYPRTVSHSEGFYPWAITGKGKQLLQSVCSYVTSFLFHFSFKKFIHEYYILYHVQSYLITCQRALFWRRLISPSLSIPFRDCTSSSRVTPTALIGWLVSFGRSA